MVDDIVASASKLVFPPPAPCCALLTCLFGPEPNFEIENKQALGLGRKKNTGKMYIRFGYKYHITIRCKVCSYVLIGALLFEIIMYTLIGAEEI
jgi:hypothetical protein